MIAKDIYLFCNQPMQLFQPTSSELKELLYVKQDRINFAFSEAQIFFYYFF